MILSFKLFIDLSRVPWCKGPGVFGGARTMETYVEVTVTIGVAIDAEYSSAEHAGDIIENVRRLFPGGDMTVHEVQARQSNEPKHEMRYRLA
jgi:hypothetical protein